MCLTKVACVAKTTPSRVVYYANLQCSFFDCFTFSFLERKPIQHARFRFATKMADGTTKRTHACKVQANSTITIIHTYIHMCAFVAQVCVFACWNFANKFSLCCNFFQLSRTFTKLNYYIKRILLLLFFVAFILQIRKWRTTLIFHC